MRITYSLKFLKEIKQKTYDYFIKNGATEEQAKEAAQLNYEIYQTMREQELEYYKNR